jgi:hypothetical protein
VGAWWPNGSRTTVATSGAGRGWKDRYHLGDHGFDFRLFYDLTGRVALRGPLPDIWSNHGKFAALRPEYPLVRG